MNRLLIGFFCLTTFTACSQNEQKAESPAGYDFNNPVTYTMPDELREISGITFRPGANDMMYAIQDEAGILFSWKNGEAKNLNQSEFGKHGDFEDIAITKTYTFVLLSDGTLIQFPTTKLGASNIDSTREWKDILPMGEYESLYADAGTNELYVLCKNCEVDKKVNAISGYILQLNENGELTLKSNFKINTVDIPDPGSKKKAKIRPSAMAFSHKANQWYILSSVNKLLIIADTNWKISQTIKLSPKFFPQPEGITFDSDHNLYISNEAGNTSAGTVLKFPVVVGASK
jgi:hypothetical protein